MAPPRDAFNIALIGYGYAGRTFHAPLIDAVDGLALRAVVSRYADCVRASLPAIQVVSDPATVFSSSDIDLVVIATPNDTHAPLARAALEAGKNVVVDKPFTLDLAEARELIALAERKNLMLSVFHNRRWDSDFLSIQQALDKDLIGDVSHFESHFDRFRPSVRDRWRERQGPGSGIWFDLGPHLVDQALQLFGLPDVVQANFAQQRHLASTDDWAHIVMHYGKRRVILHATMLAAGGTRRFVAHGTSGSMVKRLPDRQEEQLVCGMAPGAPGWGDDADELILYQADGTQRRLASVAGDQRRYYQGIANALRQLAPNPVPPFQALAVMAVMEAARSAARRQTSLSLTLSEEERAAWT